MMAKCLTCRDKGYVIKNERVMICRDCCYAPGSRFFGFGYDEALRRMALAAIMDGVICDLEWPNNLVTYASSAKESGT